MYLHQKGDFESTRKDALEFAKEKYFNGHSDTRLNPSKALGPDELHPRVLKELATELGPVFAL